MRRERGRQQVVELSECKDNEDVIVKENERLPSDSKHTYFTVRKWSGSEILVLFFM